MRGDRRHAALGAGVDAAHQHTADALAVRDQRARLDIGRDREHVRFPGDARRERLPVPERCIEAAQRRVRGHCQDPPLELALEAVHHRQHHQQHRDAKRDTDRAHQRDERQEAVVGLGAQVARREPPLQEGPGAHS